MTSVQHTALAPRVLARPVERPAGAGPGPALAAAASAAALLALVVEPGPLTWALAAMVWSTTLLTSVGILLVRRRLGRIRTELARHLSAAQAQVLLVDEDGETSTAEVGHLRPGDLVVLGAGQEVPVESAVESEQGSLDASLVTGCAADADLRPALGDTVHAGSRVLSGALVLRVLAMSGAGVVLRGTGRPLPSRRSGSRDDVAAVLAGVVLTLVLTAAALALSHGGGHPLVVVTVVTLVVLPWWLPVCHRLAELASCLRLHERGLLLKDPAEPARAAETDVALLDKTGTLTATGHHPGAGQATGEALKPDAQPAVAALRRLGVRTVLVTGDDRASAEGVAAQLAVDEVVAHATAAEKARLVRDYRTRGYRPAFVGDGANDAAALGEATVSIAMGSGAQDARRAASVVDLSSGPSSLVRLVTAGRTARHLRELTTAAWVGCAAALLWGALPLAVDAGTAGAVITPAAALAPALGAIALAAVAAWLAVGLALAAPRLPARLVARPRPGTWTLVLSAFAGAALGLGLLTVLGALLGDLL